MKILLWLWNFLSLSKRAQLMVMRLLQDEFLIGVTGIVLNKQNQILVVKHTYRDGDSWSLPGGYLRKKEHPKEGLAREIEEETGFIVRIHKHIKIRTDRDTARIDITLVGSYIGGEFRPSHEVSEAGFFSFDNLPLLPQNQLLLIHTVLDKRHVSIENRVTDRTSSL